MKAFLIWYWLTGCLICGLALGNYADKCPRNDVKSYEVAAAVIVWPVAVISALAMSSRPPLECTRP